MKTHFRKISTKKYLNNKLVNDPSLEENISKLTKLEKISSEKYKNNYESYFKLYQSKYDESIKKIAFQNSENLRSLGTKVISCKIFLKRMICLIHFQFF